MRTGMIDEITEDAEVRMGKSIESLRVDLGKVRTGRAHPSLLDHVMVDYYGSEVPLKQVANVNTEDARTLTITPWEILTCRDSQSRHGIHPSSIH